MAYTDIDNPELYFQTKLYTGTGSSHAITLDGSENMAPDWVWIKCRDDSHNHQVFDSVRGVHKRMRTDTSGAETESSESLKSFDSDGFTLGTQANVNNPSNTFVSWNWKKTADAGFDIVSYIGNGSNRTISHSLSAVPKVMFVKRRSSTSDWTCYFETLGNTKRVILNSNAVPDTASTFWNSTTPTSSVFSVGTSGGTNASSETYIAYLFSEKKGFSKFSSFVGNGSDDGTFVYTGFKPAFILLKNTSVSASWLINDNKRNGFNPNSRTITPNNSEVENTGTDRTDFLSNGFKLRVGSSTAWNGSGNTIIYMAFAEEPLVGDNPATAR